jgi:3-hydroxybenzoate 6-monooxygenase
MISILIIDRIPGRLTARFYGDIYHAAGVQRELRNQLFRSGNESAGFAGLKWMYDGIEPSKLFQCKNDLQR